MKNGLILWLLFFLAGHTWAKQADLVFSGTIGKYPIVMKITLDDSECGGEYFYESSKRDIEIVGVKKGGSYYLVNLRRNYDRGTDDTTESFALTAAGNGKLKGTWTQRNKKMDVVLRPLDVAAIVHPYASYTAVKAQKRNDPYAYKRSSLYAIVRDSSVQKGSFKLDYFHVDKTGVHMFTIAAGLDAAAAAKINEQLKDVLITFADAAYSCTAPDGSGSFDFDITGCFLTPQLVSVIYHLGYDCGGVHPDDAEEALNFNAVTGEALELEDVLHLAGPPPTDKNGSDFAAYRDDVYVPKLMALLKKLFPKFMVSKDNCDYATPEVWTFPKWYFTQKGIQIDPDFPHVSAECGYPDWSEIPYSELRKYLDPAKKIMLP